MGINYLGMVRETKMILFECLKYLNFSSEIFYLSFFLNSFQRQAIS